MTFIKFFDVKEITNPKTNNMKNFTITSIVFLLSILISNTGFAQTANASSGGFTSGLSFGVKVGANFSNMYGDVGNNSFLFFPHAGLVVDKALSNKLTVSTEPHFSGEGQILNGGYDRIIYFNIPVLGKFKVTEPLTLDGGVHVGVKITERTKFGTTGRTENRNRFKRIAPGFTVGATYDVMEDWFVQFRTNLKLSDVVRKEGGDSEGSVILAFQLSIGKRF